jgi:hypothetical protein
MGGEVPVAAGVKKAREIPWDLLRLDPVVVLVCACEESEGRKLWLAAGVSSKAMLPFQKDQALTFSLNLVCMHAWMIENVLCAFVYLSVLSTPRVPSTNASQYTMFYSYNPSRLIYNSYSFRDNLPKTKVTSHLIIS